MSIIRKFKIKQISDRYGSAYRIFSSLIVGFTRQLDKKSFASSSEKRNTGFELSWYYEDYYGNKQDIENIDEYLIYFPTNLASILELYPNIATAVLNMDVNLFPGLEYKQIYQNIDFEYRDYYFFGRKYEYKLDEKSNITKVRTYDLTNSDMDQPILIGFARNLNKSSNVSSPGFQLSWYYEDGDGQRVDIENIDIEQDDGLEGRIVNKKIGDIDDRFVQYKNIFGRDVHFENKHYVTFMNFLFEIVNNTDISLETLWDIAKKYRLDDFHKKSQNNWKVESKCDEGELGDFMFRGVANTDDYINYFSSSLNISFTLQDKPVYKDQITDSLLTSGFHLFHYIARCEDIDRESIMMFKKYIELFNSNSTRTILESALEIKNIDRKQKVGRDIWNTSSADKLMEYMDEIFDLNIYKLEVLSSTDYSTEDIRNEQIRDKLNICKQDESCEELMAILRDQGDERFFFNLYRLRGEGQNDLHFFITTKRLKNRCLIRLD